LVRANSKADRPNDGFDAALRRGIGAASARHRRGIGAASARHRRGIGAGQYPRANLCRHARAESDVGRPSPASTYLGARLSSILIVDGQATRRAASLPSAAQFEE